MDVRARRAIIMTSVIVCVMLSASLILSTYANYNSFGPFRTLLYSDWITCDHNKNMEVSVNETQVFFYDFANDINATSPIDQAVNIISTYNLDVTRRFIVFVPGYKSHISKKTEELIRQTFQNVPNTYLIIFDHSTYTTSRPGKLKGYERAVYHTYYLGRAVGKFLTELRRKGVPSRNIHCVGHSLGSQMLGYAGSAYINATGEKLWRVTAIDPAGPCFSNSLIEEQIRSGVAEYVEVYHCNAGGLGTTSVLGDADFFFNYEGAIQPKCNPGILPGKGESDAAKCSHKACVRYWAYTVHNPGYFLAWKCDSYKEFNKGRCAGNEVTIAGYSNPGNATGVFYVSTDGYYGLY
ncbi:unnamed protein product [Plutella xylostella]|uniref:(diamondback moth) hypothetical protein n=1 Tax=Plutella xylostella TaxID=51655 RepID=A0A8S4G1W3_PLUXY|nr:unnamed protein product [Plutella xylostella]